MTNQQDPPRPSLKLTPKPGSPVKPNFGATAPQFSISKTPFSTDSHPLPNTLPPQLVLPKDHHYPHPPLIPPPAPAGSPPSGTSPSTPVPPSTSPKSAPSLSPTPKLTPTPSQRLNFLLFPIHRLLRLDPLQ